LTAPDPDTDNHRPPLSSEVAPSNARIKQSARDGSYNLGFDDNGDKYQYNGVRTGEDDKFILVFDMTRKAFVLHRVDSMFHMNVTRTPNNTNAETLAEEFPRLEVKGNILEGPKKPPPKAAAASSKSKDASPAKGGRKQADKGGKKKEVESHSLMLPDPSQAPPPMPEAPPEKKKSKQPAVSEDEEESDGGDDPLMIEYPEGPGPTTKKYSSSFEVTRMPVQRRFSEFVRDHVSEGDEDADAEEEEDAPGEDDDEYDDHRAMQDFKLPSPVGHHRGNGAGDGYGSDSNADAIGEADDDDDIAAAIMRDLEFGNHNDSESDVSEED
jgi:hypothetical protein